MSEKNRVQLSDDSCDYNPSMLRELDDKRFVIAKKEAIIAQAAIFITVILETIIAFALCPEDTSKINYICGFPAWFFAVTILSILAYAFGNIYTYKFSKNFSLDAKSDEEV